MAPILPNIEPVQATAGSTWTWKVSSPLYPIAEGWTLAYAVRGLGALPWNTSWITNDGASFTVIIPPASTLPLEAGTYEITRVWTGSGTYAGRTDYEALPNLTVLPDPVTAAPEDRVSFAEKNLKAVEVAIQARLAGDQPQEYTIGNRSVVKMEIGELMALRAKLRTELWQLRNPGKRTSVSVRFTRPAA